LNFKRLGIVASLYHGVSFGLQYSLPILYHQTSSSAPRKNLVYTIGDTGPAGGVVFYDKGTYSNGWRYLEAWTADEPGTYQWKTDHPETPGTNTTIGSGYTNTYKAMSGTGHPAAEAMRKANHGGYSDWFLPSKDELNLMFEQKETIGSFTPDYYWSSSEDQYGGVWDQLFSNGYQGSYPKPYSKKVRAVRTVKKSDSPMAVASDETVPGSQGIVPLSNGTRLNDQASGSGGLAQPGTTSMRRSGQMITTVPRGAIKVDGKTDDWGGQLPLWKSASNFDRYPNQPGTAVTEWSLCRDDRYLYFRADFSDGTPTSRLASDMYQQLTYQLNIRMENGDMLLLEAGFNKTNGPASYAVLYNDRTRKGTRLDNVTVTHKTGDGTLEFRAGLQNLRKYLDQAVWGTTFIVADASNDGNWRSHWSSANIQVAFGK